MSPHQREFTAAAFTLKSRMIASAAVAAAGSGTVVLFHRFASHPRSPAAAISRAIRLRA